LIIFIHVKEIYEYLSSALIGGTSASRSTAVLGLTALTLLSLNFNLLPTENQATICSRITTVATDDGDVEVRKRSVDSLVSIARTLPGVIQEHALPVLLQRIRLNTATHLSSSHAPSHDHTAAVEHAHGPSQALHNPDAQLLTAVASLCVAPAIYEKVVNELLTMIQQLLLEDAKLPASDPQPTSYHDTHHMHLRAHQTQAVHLLACLADSVSHNTPNTETVAQFCTTFIPTLLASLIELVTSSPPSPSAVSQIHRSAQPYLTHSLRLVRILTQHAEEDIQVELFAKVTSILVAEFYSYIIFSFFFFFFFFFL
jgi:hypothetical protein